MTKKIIVCGHVDCGISSLMLATMKEKHGDDIVLITPEQAKEQGLKMEDFDNIPRMKITAPPINELICYDFKSGKQNRRDRRQKERKSNKI